jgi:excisionase family DNA binding protein
MANSEQIDGMLTVREVALLLHIHPNTVRRWSNRGKIRTYRITPRGDRRFRREEIARFLAELNTNRGNWREA